MHLSYHAADFTPTSYKLASATSGIGDFPSTLFFVTFPYPGGLHREIQPT
jgi:hypothetical protein